MIVALAGGVGGAKLADGLAAVLGGDLSVVVNTGDDFEHFGLAISPDLDTVMYTLAGIANPETGWGISGETWNFLDLATRLGGPAWFRIGDRDLATHVLRSERLRRGERLTLITADLCRRLGIKAHILPMSDAPVRTVVHTPRGCPRLSGIFRRSALRGRGHRIRIRRRRACAATEEVRAALQHPALAAIVICPSNPFVSIDPILAVPELRDLLRARNVPVVAVSPIIGGAAVKGPAAKMMRELGREVSAAAVAAYYRGLAHGVVIDEADAGLAAQIEAMEMAVRIVPTLMRSSADRRDLALACLDFARYLASGAAAQ